MAKQAGGNRAIGPREAKAIHTLMSAKDVARDVERLRHRLADPHLPPAQALRDKAEMNDALSRLCNLISLAIAEINENVGEQFRQHFDMLLGEVRGRLLQMNFHHMLERLVDIRNQAQDALKTQEYRMGLAARLDRAYADVVEHLVAMGATEGNGLEARFLDEITEDLRTLAEIEVRVFKLIDFDALEHRESQTGD
jgi:hypothetical protein